MTAEQWAMFFVLAGQIPAAILGFLSWYRSERNSKKLDSQSHTLDKQTTSVNGRLDQLVATTKDASYRQGYMDGFAAAAKKLPDQPLDNGSK